MYNTFIKLRQEFTLSIECSFKPVKLPLQPDQYKSSNRSEVSNAFSLRRGYKKGYVIMLLYSADACDVHCALGKIEE